MHAWRSFLRHRRWPAAWLVAAALLMKLVVPSGFMPVISADRITITLCSGMGPETMTTAMPGMDHHHSGGAGHGGRDMPCGFGGLSVPSLAAADATLPVTVVHRIVADLIGGEARLGVAAPSHLRPPLRGPPRPR